jgi:hypothetical protein
MSCNSRSGKLASLASDRSHMSPFHRAAGRTQMAIPTVHNGAFVMTSLISEPHVQKK